jgi:hypothetical protein
MHKRMVQSGARESRQRSGSSSLDYAPDIFPGISWAPSLWAEGVLSDIFNRSVRDLSTRVEIPGVVGTVASRCLGRLRTRPSAKFWIYVVASSRPTTNLSGELEEMPAGARIGLSVLK